MQSKTNALSLIPIANIWLSILLFFFPHWNWTPLPRSPAVSLSSPLPQIGHWMGFIFIIPADQSLTLKLQPRQRHAEKSEMVTSLPSDEITPTWVSSSCGFVEPQCKTKWAQIRCNKPQVSTMSNVTSLVIAMKYLNNPHWYVFIMYTCTQPGCCCVFSFKSTIDFKSL